MPWPHSAAADFGRSRTTSIMISRQLVSEAILIMSARWALWGALWIIKKLLGERFLNADSERFPEAIPNSGRIPASYPCSIQSADV